MIAGAALAFGIIAIFVHHTCFRSYWSRRTNECQTNYSKQRELFSNELTPDRRGDIPQSGNIHDEFVMVDINECHESNSVFHDSHQTYDLSTPQTSVDPHKVAVEDANDNGQAGRSVQREEESTFGND